MPRAPRTEAAATTPRTRPYHHGKLRQALVDMAVTVAEETGKDLVSVREVARRLGVSSGAPFRHFPDREALMTAVAEEATMRLRLTIERELATAPRDPFERLKVLGRGFIGWALAHPTQFRLVSSRRLFDFDGSPSLAVHFGAVRETTLRLVADAQAAGSLPPGATQQWALGLRALVYGLARMQVDGQLPQWGIRPETARAPGVPPDAQAALVATMDLLLDGLRR